MVPYQIFSQMKPEDFNAKTLEEHIWQMGVWDQFDVNIYFPPDKQDYYSGIQAWQMPCQLADYLEYLYANKDEMKINSYLEIGVWRGGLFFIMDSFFRAINPDYQGSVALDLLDYMFEFKNYKRKFETVEFVKSNSLDYIPNKAFDLTFIDSNHTYEHTVKEFNIYKPYSKYMAFHDINNPVYGPGVIKFWQEIKTQYQSWETTRRYIQEHDIMGIGLIKIAV